MLFLLIILLPINSCILNLTPKIAKSLRLWWTYALDPAYRRVARNVRVTAMYLVEGVRSSQPMIWAVASPTPLRRHGLVFKSR